MIVAKPTVPPPGKRVGQAGKVECDHPKRRGPLAPRWEFPHREGDVCDACGWKEAVPMRILHEDGTSEEVSANELFRRLLDRGAQ